MKQLPLIIALVTFWSHSFTQAPPMPPVAQRTPHEIKTINGDVRTDYYYWISDRSNKKVMDYLVAENAYLATSMKHTEPLQLKLFEEMKGRVKEDESSVPYKKGDY